MYNTIHGSIGLILGEGAACKFAVPPTALLTPLAVVFLPVVGGMLLGLHILREFEGVDTYYVHYAIYSLSSTIGLIIMLAALFNIYTVNYRKSECTMVFIAQL